jgi:Tol biopolymer transport system component
LVVDLEDGQTVVERLRDGARWVIPNGGRPVSFSPDGRRVAWSVVHGLANFDLRRTEIWLADADGRRARMIAARFGGGIVGWMPDAMGLLVGGRRSPHAATAELTLFDLAHESERALLFYERLRGPAVSPSGRWLVYFVTQASDPAQNGAFALDLSRSPAAPQRLDLFGAYRWRDGERLLCVPMKPGLPSDELWQLDLARGQRRLLIRAEAGSPFKIANNEWEVSPDGTTLVFLSARDRNLWLVRLP